MIAETSIQFNDGSYGGMIKIDALVTRLNAIENKINAFALLFNAHTHTANNTVIIPAQYQTPPATLTTKLGEFGGY